MGKKNKIVFFLGIIGFSFAGFALPVDAQTESPKTHGWAWSENIGWISFNSRDCDIDGDLMYEGYGETGGPAPAECPTSGAVKKYSVEADPTTGVTAGDLDGYAWSENIGWIRFDPEENPINDPYPNPGTEAPGTMDLPATLELTETSVDPNLRNCKGNAKKHEICGWARACSVFVTGCSGALKPDTERGGWDGWISLRGFVPKPENFFSDDFESGNLDKWNPSDLGDKEPGNTVEIISGSNATPTVGGSILHTKTLGGSAADAAYIKKNIITTDEMYVRFKFNLAADLPGTHTDRHTISSVNYAPGGTNYIVSLGIRRTTSDLNNSLNVNIEAEAPGNKWRDTGIDLFSDRWYCLEYHMKRDPATGRGEVQVWVDSVEVINYSGPTDVYLGTNPITWLRLGAQAGPLATEYFYDDYGGDATQRVDCGAPLPQPEDPDLIGHWKFDDQLDPTTDSSAFQKHGNLESISTPADWVADRFGGKALKFHRPAGGSNEERMEVINLHSAIAGSNPRTFTAWVKIDSGTGGIPGRILSQGTLTDGQDASGQDFTFRVENISGTNSMVLYYGGGNSIRYTFPGGVGGGTGVGEWFHFAVVVPKCDTPPAVCDASFGDGDGFVEANEITAYITGANANNLNKRTGTLSGSCDPGPPANTCARLNTFTSTFFVGGHGTSSSNGRNIDEVRAYKAALGPGQIKLIKDSGGSRAFGISWAPATGEIQGWGWGGVGIGWISFSQRKWCDDGGTPPKSNGGLGCPPLGQDYVKSTVYLNREPAEPTNLTATPPASMCGLSTVPITFQWSFIDPDLEDVSDAYQVIADTSSGLWSLVESALDLNSCRPNDHNSAGPLTGGAGTCVAGTGGSLYTPSPSPFAFNTTYFWSVRTKDNHGQFLSRWSNWVKPAVQFTTPPQAPTVDFTYTPANPTQNEVVTFTNLSSCPGGSCTYEWDFQYDGSYSAGEIDCTSATTCTYTYSTPISGNRVYLRVTPSTGGMCEKEKSLDIFIPFPGWKEISPF